MTADHRHLHVCHAHGLHGPRTRCLVVCLLKPKYGVSGPHVHRPKTRTEVQVGTVSAVASVARAGGALARLQWLLLAASSVEPARSGSSYTHDR